MGGGGGGGGGGGSSLPSSFRLSSFRLPSFRLSSLRLSSLRLSSLRLSSLRLSPFLQNRAEQEVCDLSSAGNLTTAGAHVRHYTPPRAPKGEQRTLSERGYELHAAEVSRAVFVNLLW